MDYFGRRLFDHLFGSSSIDVAEDDFGAFRVEGFDSGCPDAVSAACEDNHFTAQAVEPGWIW